MPAIAVGASTCLHAEAELSLRIDRSVVRAGHFQRSSACCSTPSPLSPPLAERLKPCGIDCDFRKGQKPSDHAPLLAELRG